MGGSAEGPCWAAGWAAQATGKLHVIEAVARRGTGSLKSPRAVRVHVRTACLPCRELQHPQGAEAYHLPSASAPCSGCRGGRARVLGRGACRVSWAACMSHSVCQGQMTVGGDPAAQPAGGRALRWLEGDRTKISLLGDKEKFAGLQLIAETKNNCQSLHHCHINTHC